LPDPEGQLFKEIGDLLTNMPPILRQLESLIRADCNHQLSAQMFLLTIKGTPTLSGPGSKRSTLWQDVRPGVVCKLSNSQILLVLDLISNDNGQGNDRR
jgi:hypothetical protein